MADAFKARVDGTIDPGDQLSIGQVRLLPGRTLEVTVEGSKSPLRVSIAQLGPAGGSKVVASSISTKTAKLVSYAQDDDARFDIVLAAGPGAKEVPFLAVLRVF